MKEYNAKDKRIFAVSIEVSSIEDFAFLNSILHEEIGSEYYVANSSLWHTRPTPEILGFTIIALEEDLNIISKILDLLDILGVSYETDFKERS